MRQNLVTAALAHFDEAVKAHPSDARAHYYRGVCLQHLRKNNEAVAAYQKAVGLSPHFPEKYQNLGGMLLLQRKLGQAEEVLSSAVKRFKDQPELWHNLGLALSWQNKTRKAAHAFDRAATLGRQADAFLASGVCFLRLGEWAEALARFRKAIGASDTLSKAYHGAAKALRHLGRFKEALGYAQKAVSLDPTNPAARHLLGLLLLDLKEPRKALSAFEKALVRAPRAASLHLGLARAQLMSGRAAKAFASARTAMLWVDKKNAILLAEIEFTTAEILKAMGRCRRALPLYRKAMGARGITAERRKEMEKGYRACGGR